MKNLEKVLTALLTEYIGGEQFEKDLKALPPEERLPIVLKFLPYILPKGFILNNEDEKLEEYKERILRLANTLSEDRY